MSAATMTSQGTGPSESLPRVAMIGAPHRRSGRAPAWRRCPPPICSMASVMMKEGMPIWVTPKAVITPSNRQLTSASRIAATPGSGTLAMATLASWRVKKATMMPVALATLATLRSISAQRMTKVSPVAMIPVMEIWVRMLLRLPSVAKEGVARLKKTTSTSNVMKGAMLRNWPRNQRRGALALSSRSRSVSTASPVLVHRSIALLRLPPAGGPC